MKVDTALAKVSDWESLKTHFCFFLVRIGWIEAHLICEVCDREVDLDNIHRHYVAFHPEHPVAKKTIE